METATSSPITTISDIGKHEGQSVTIRGWLYNLRESGKLLFPIFRDGSGFIQGVIAKAAVSPEMFETVKGLTQESSVIVTGAVRADKRAKGGYELDVQAVQVIAKASDESISALRRTGRKIVLLQATPLPPDENFNQVSCLSTGSKQCRFEVNPNPTPLDQYSVSAANQPNTWSLDLDRLACPRLPVCDPVVNGIIVRRDHTHLTATYARALSDSLAALLHQEGALPAPKQRP